MARVQVSASMQSGLMCCWQSRHFKYNQSSFISSPAIRIFLPDHLQRWPENWTAWAGTGWSRPSEGTGRESEGKKTKRDKVSKLLQLCGLSSHRSVKNYYFHPLTYQCLWLNLIWNHLQLFAFKAVKQSVDYTAHNNSHQSRFLCNNLSIISTFSNISNKHEKPLVHMYILVGYF